MLGALPADRYDAAVPPGWRTAALWPEARTIGVVASGGHSLWDAMARSGVLASGLSDPVDHHTREAVRRAVAALEAEGHPSRALLAFETVDGTHADFVALARAAGLGAPSRLGLLLHPEFGPWWSIRAVILTSAQLRQTPWDPAFDPCEGCPAPCQSACPTAAPGSSGFDLAACERGRASNPPCREGCAARSACPVGAEHAYPREALAHHMRFR